MNNFISRFDVIKKFLLIFTILSIVIPIFHVRAADGLEGINGEALALEKIRNKKAKAKKIEKELETVDYYEPNDLFAKRAREEVVPYTKEELRKKIKIAAKRNSKDYATHYIIGYMYQNGEVLEHSYKKAALWYEKAAKGGHVPSMKALGNLYQMGMEDDLPRNSSKAMSWYKKAANTGDAEAAYEIALIYENGEGTFQSDKKAMKFYKKAAKNGELNAYVKLGLFYQYGRGIKEPNLKKAIKYFKSLYEKSDNENVRKQVNLLLSNVYFEIAKSNPNKKKRFEWLKVAASAGNKDASRAVADAYRDGRGVDQDYAKAMKIYMKMSEAEDTYAMENLGYMHSNGLGVEVDFKEALKWYLKAAERGSCEAAWNMGNFYHYGRGVELNYNEASKWFTRSKNLCGKRN